MPALRLAFSRRCPRCGSHALSKTGRHGYQCHHRHRFLGYRLGPLRMSMSLRVDADAQTFTPEPKRHRP